MSTTRWIFILLAVVVTFSGCQNVYPKRADILSNSGGSIELILNGRVSLPLPERYEKIWSNESSIIISQSDTSIGYRWIDKEEIEFIGSEKTPYNFFKSAFNNPSMAEEKRFIEGLGSIVKRSHSSANNLEFYHFDLESRQKIYILSGSLDFVVEVTSKGGSKRYLESIIKQSYIR